MGGLYLREDYRFNTQPPEGGCIIGFNLFPYLLQFQHTAARRRLRRVSMLKTVALPFQHTAARRRLHAAQEYYQQLIKVSTHSRPKAAAHRKALKIYQT